MLQEREEEIGSLQSDLRQKADDITGRCDISVSPPVKIKVFGIHSVCSFMYYSLLYMVILASHILFPYYDIIQVYFLLVHHVRDDADEAISLVTPEGD